jgi:hypothetical protein
MKSKEEIISMLLDDYNTGYDDLCIFKDELPELERKIKKIEEQKVEELKKKDLAKNKTAIIGADEVYIFKKKDFNEAFE